MRSPNRSQRVLLFALVLGCCGCTISVQPCRSWKAAPDAIPGDPTYGVPAAARAPVPPPGLPQPPPGMSSEQMALLLQRLSTSDDDRKALGARLQQLEVQLRDKDQAVVQTTYEVQESTKQMKRTRDDLVRWKQDMDGLRVKLAGMERENKVTLEAILKTLEQYVEREKDTDRR
jgi:hypothetical protein